MADTLLFILLKLAKKSFITDNFSSITSLHKERLSRGRIFSVERRRSIVSNWRQFIRKIYCDGWPHISADQRWSFLFLLVWSLSG